MGTDGSWEGTERRRGGAGAAVLWIAGGMALFAAAVAGWYYIDPLGSRLGADKAGAGSVAPDDPTVSMRTDRLYVKVKVLDEGGNEFAVGTPLPRRLQLEARGEDGNRYIMPFDRVGSWAVEAPYGTFFIPLEQKGLGNWRWKVSGSRVRKDRANAVWVVSFQKSDGRSAIELTLY